MPRLHLGTTAHENIAPFVTSASSMQALSLSKDGGAIFGAMTSNLCVESHPRDLLELGFEAAVVKDATAAAKVPEDVCYQGAVINFRFMADKAWTTDEAVRMIT